jgi:hypothetical protein
MMDIPDGTPKWSGMDGTSQLLNDEGIPIDQKCDEMTGDDM